MKKILCLVALTLSFTAVAFEEKVSFTHFENQGWGYAYYSCDYAESQTEKHLEVLGATNVSVRCNGGIEHGRMWPVSVTATFDAPVLSGREIAEVVKVKGDRRNPSCGLNVAIWKAILPKFSNVTVLSKKDSCSFADTNYSYELSIVR